MENVYGFHIKDDVSEVFERAISDGRMSLTNAHMYMYMGTQHGKDTFKHVDTREYLA